MARYPFYYNIPNFFLKSLITNGQSRVSKLAPNKVITLGPLEVKNHKPVSWNSCSAPLPLSTTPNFENIIFWFFYFVALVIKERRPIIYFLLPVLIVILLLLLMSILLLTLFLRKKRNRWQWKNVVCYKVLFNIEGTNGWIYEIWSQVWERPGITYMLYQYPHVFNCVVCKF